MRVFKRVCRIVMMASLPLLMVVALAAEQPRQIQPAARVRAVDLNPRHLRIADEPVGERPIQDWNESFVAKGGLGLTASAPGLKVAWTAYDFQHNDAVPHQIATNGGSPYVHFAWTNWGIISESLGCEQRTVNFRTYNSATGSFLYGTNGVEISGSACSGARGGFATVGIDDSDRAVVSFHQRAPSQRPSGDYSSWVLIQSSPTSSVFAGIELNQSAGLQGMDDDKIWPHVTVDQVPGSPDMIHVVAHTYSTDDNIVYWRYEGIGWQGPVVVDSSLSLSYNIAADRTSDRAALLTTDEVVRAANPNGLRQITCRESQDNGASWINGTGLGDARKVFITGYDDPAGPAAWLDCIGDYDNGGNLHVVWNEKRYASDAASTQAAWKHWDKNSGTISVIRLAYWDNAGSCEGRRINIGLPSLGFGDGSTTCNGQSNLDWIYLTFVQFGGPTASQQNDYSTGGFMNGEVYLSVSSDGGSSWSPAVNLTNTLSPGCDPRWDDSCQSENFPTMARTVNDTLHIMYIADRDAGVAPFGQGAWTFNPVMYYRIPGGANAQPICAALAPSFYAELTKTIPNCEYHAPPGGSLTETLRIRNVGNATLTGVISVEPPSSWLTVAGAGSYSLPQGSSNLTFSVTMNATSLAQGFYEGSISITHNDPTLPSPYVIPVSFFVFPSFVCEQHVVLSTKWLSLQVSNVTRIAGQNPTGGLYRPPSFGTLDSGNSSIYDGSLIIGKPPSPETLVYRDLYGKGKGQPGFRALSDLTWNVSAYGTSKGMAYATAQLTTFDSTIGIKVTYEFPQNPDSSDLLLVTYRVSNRTSNSIPGLIFGEAIDFNVLPSTWISPFQRGTENSAGVNTNYNLIYQQGKDSGSTPYAARFLGGMTAIQCAAAPRAWSAPNTPWLTGRPGGGFSDGYLYSQMTRSGFQIIPPWPPPATGGVDMHSAIVFEKDVTLQPSTVKYYTLGLVSSTQGPGTTDLLNTVKKAWRFGFGLDTDIPSNLWIWPCSTASFTYHAIGTHEGGLGSGCCGCIVTKVSGDSLWSITPGADPCEGTLHFAGSGHGGQFSATIRLQTPPCIGFPQYTEDRVISIGVGYIECYCGDQGDMDGIPPLDVMDVLRLISVVFRNGTDQEDVFCPIPRSDLNYDHVSDVMDIIYLINLVFLNGPRPVDPCIGAWDCP